MGYLTVGWSWRVVILMVNSTHMDLQHILTRGCWGPFFEDIINIFFQILHLIFIKFLWLNWLRRWSSNGEVKGSNPARAWNFFFHIFLFFATFFKPWAEPRLSFYYSKVIKKNKEKTKKDKKKNIKRKHQALRKICICPKTWKPILKMFQKSSFFWNLHVPWLMIHTCTYQW